MTDSGVNAFDLEAPTRSLLAACSDPRDCDVCGRPLPIWSESIRPFRQQRPDGHASCRARLEAERKAAAEAEFAEASSDWDRQYARHAESPALLAVLNLHYPALDSKRHSVGCAECREYDGCDGTEPVLWPCDTHTAVIDN